jgi:hypothetical protein
MKTTMLISARREPTLWPRIVRILCWQGVFPGRLDAVTVGVEHVQVLLELPCDAWRLRRLLVHWEKIIGVQSVVVAPAEDPGARPPAGAEQLCPVMR